MQTLVVPWSLGASLVVSSGRCVCVRAPPCLPVQPRAWYLCTPSLLPHPHSLFPHTHAHSKLDLVAVLRSHSTSGDHSLHTSISSALSVSTALIVLYQTPLPPSRCVLPLLSSLLSPLAPRPCPRSTLRFNPSPRSPTASPRPRLRLLPPFPALATRSPSRLAPKVVSQPQTSLNDS